MIYIVDLLSALYGGYTAAANVLKMVLVAFNLVLVIFFTGM